MKMVATFLGWISSVWRGILVDGSTAIVHPVGELKQVKAELGGFQKIQNPSSASQHAGVLGSVVHGYREPSPRPPTGLCVPSPGSQWEVPWQPLPQRSES